MSTDTAPSADDDEEADYVFHIVASTIQNYSLREYNFCQLQAALNRTVVAAVFTSANRAMFRFVYLPVCRII